ADSPDSRQSLAGLRYTMESVLRMHEREEKAFAPRSQEEPKYIRDVAGARRGGRCMHCHQLREGLNNDPRKKGKLSRDRLWPCPLRENLGFGREIDRGNVIKTVQEKTPAATAGLQAGDVVQRLNGVPVHSFADAQFALDVAPATGTIEIAWRRGDKEMKEKLA